MSRINKIKGMLLLCGVLFFTSGCEQESQVTTDREAMSLEDVAKTEFTIGVTMASAESDYQVKLEEMMTAYAEQSTEKIRLVIKDSNWDAKEQSNHFTEFIQQQVDAIILCPVNSKGALTGLKQAKEAGIPVINLNMKVDSVSTEYISTYVGASMEEEAILVAQLVKEELGTAGGKVAIVEGIPGSDPQIYRTEAFLKEIAETPNIEIVGMGTANWDRDKAYRVVCDLLRKHQDLDIIYAHDSNMAMGAIKAIEEANRTEIKVIGIGEGEEYEAAIVEERFFGFVLQNARYEAETSVECAIKIIKGETLLPWYKNPVETITKINVGNLKNLQNMKN